MGSTARHRLSQIAARLLALREEAMPPAAAAAFVMTNDATKLDDSHPLTAALRDAAPSDAGAIIDFVRVCESHGRGDDALGLLVPSITRRNTERHSLALIATEAAVLMIVLTVYGLFVLPQLQAVFDWHGVVLPAITHGTFVVVTFLLPVIALAAVIGLIALIWQRLPIVLGPLVHPLDRLAVRLPVVGPALRRRNSARVAGWLGVAPADSDSQRSAVEAARTWSPGIVARLCAAALTRARSGDELSQRLVETRCFDRDFAKAVAIDDPANAQKALRALRRTQSLQHDELSPQSIALLHLALGIIVAILVIAMYLPIFRLGALN